MSNQILDYRKAFQVIDEILFDKELQNIFHKYNKHIDKHKNSGFNIFNLVSEKYYHENLHSDIISVFLDCKGEHKEGSKFLKIFIDLLNQRRPELKIDFNKFSCATVQREDHRIDILIQDQISKQAIIIENKINNASDTYRQLPTYVEKMERINVVAIVYLPLEPNKKPERKDWTDDEIFFIDSKIICLPVFNREKNDFYEGWLEKCIKQSSEEGVKTILKQYSKLIQKLGGQKMDKQLYESFYKKVINQNDIYENSLLIKKIIEDLPIYRAERLSEKFKKDLAPFKICKFYEQTYMTLEGFEYCKRTFKIQVDCRIEGYKVRFWDDGWEEESDGEMVNLKYTSKLIEYLDNIKFDNKGKDEYTQEFSFPAEEELLFKFICDLKIQLQNLPNNIFTNN